MIIRDAVRKRGEEYLTFPQRALFDKIGIRRQVLETDPYGNFLLNGYDYGTARNWARLGMLYLNDGVWQGKRLLPEGWTKFVSTPAPAWKDSTYGAMVWVNARGVWPELPRDAFAFRGAGLQDVYVIPSREPRDRENGALHRHAAGDGGSAPCRSAADGGYSVDCFAGRSLRSHPRGNRCL